MLGPIRSRTWRPHSTLWDFAFAVNFEYQICSSETLTRMSLSERKEAIATEQRSDKLGLKRTRQMFGTL